MPYGEIRVDTITFTNGGVDTSITVSGLAASTTGNLTVTGTISGATVRATTVSGVTVTGTTVQGASGTFTSITGGVATITSGVFAAGSAAAPSISFSSDPNTGIYSPGADQLAISTNGTGRLFADASGTVSIGTSANPTLGTFSRPSFYIKQLSDPANGFGAVHIEAFGEQSVFGIGYDGTSQAFTFDTSYRSTGAYRPITFKTNNLERLRITSAGLVGIGTSAPNKLLHIAGTEGVVGAYQLELEGRFSGYGAGITFSSRTSSGGTLLPMAKITADGEAPWDTTAANQDAGLRFYTTLDGTLSEKLRLDSAGRLGIGTTTPQGLLDLAAADSATALAIAGWRAISWNGSILQWGGIAASQWSTAAFFTGGSERARIDSSGRLLVGTSSVRTIAGLTPRYFQEGSSTYESLGLCTNDNSFAARGSYLLFARSRGTTAGSNTIVQSGDFLGGIAFAGADGSTLQSTAATIGCEVDGTPGANDMPGRIVFSTTADGASSPTERMRIDSSGRLGIGTASPLKELQINATTPTIRLEESSASAKRLELSVSSSGEASIFATQSATQLLFGTVGTERARIDSSGRLLVGTSSALTGSVTQYGKFNLLGNTGDATASSVLNLGKGSAASSGDTLGQIFFTDNGAGQYAFIGAYADAATGTNDYPGRLVFSTTADGASSPTERLRITSAGLVGVGTSAPGATLDARGAVRVGNQSQGDGTTGISATRGLFIGTNGDTLSTTDVFLQTNAYPAAPSYATSPAQALVFSGWSGGGIWHNAIKSGQGQYISFHTAISATTYTDSNERARIDSSGRLLIGTSTARANFFNFTNTAPLQVEGTTSNTATVSVIANADASGNVPVLLLGKTRGGTVGSNAIVQNNDLIGFLTFQAADGTELVEAARIETQIDGTPGANDMPGRLVFSVTADGASSPTEAVRISQNRVTQFQNDIIPGADNVYQVGQSGRRWSVVFAGTGTINTSDANLKQDIEALEQAELNVAAAIKGLVKKFRFIDAVEAKGGAARIHIGVIAQEVEQAFIDEGLDPRRYAMFCEDTLEDGSKRLGIRYDELLAFVIAAL